MSVKDVDMVDGIGIDEKTNTLVMLISDPYPWKVQEFQHLEAVRDKIDNYLVYIDQGGYREQYGNRDFSFYRIEIAAKYKCPGLCSELIKEINNRVRGKNIIIVYMNL